MIPHLAKKYPNDNIFDLTVAISLPQAKHGSGKYGSVAEFFVSNEDDSQDIKHKVKRLKTILKK